MIDWNRVAELRDEVGPEDFDEVVDLFLTEVDEEIGELDAQVTVDDLAAKLHFLKGSALSLGFSEFSDLCAASEKQVATHGVNDVDIASIVGSYNTSRALFVEQLPAQIAAQSSL